jgi:hypothetical protein
LTAGLDGKLRTERFNDMDLVSVEGESVLIKENAKSRLPLFVGLSLALVLLPVFVLLLLRTSRVDRFSTNDLLRMPKEITPFSAVITLRRFAQQHATKMSSEEYSHLQAEIARLEQRYFATDANADPGDAEDVLTRWHHRLAAIV